MTKLNVAFIGCGRIADLHAPGYDHNPDARIYAVCDRNRDLLARRQAEWSAERAFTELEEVLADPNVDAVEILTPQLLHEPMTLKALASGKHVALQKPMSIDLPSARRMLRAAARSGRVFKITENYVFYPPLVLARRLIEDGAIGEPIGMRIHYLGGSTGGWKVPATAWVWRIQEAAAGRGFVTFDHGHHLLSTAWFLLGEVERVAGWIDSIDGVVDAPSVFMWKYAGAKRYGVCDIVHGPELNVPSKYYSNDEWVEITGSRGVIRVSRCTGNVHDGPPVLLFDGTRWRPFVDVPSDWGAGFVGATQNFIDAIRGRAEPLLSAEQAFGILRFALAVQRAARERREVFLDEMEHPFPRLYSRGRRQQEQRAEHGGFFARLGLGQSLSRYAREALSLTEDVVRHYDVEAARKVETLIGLHLTADNGVEEKLALRVAHGTPELTRGELPEGAALTVMVPAGVWAAILLKKKRLETALFQGKIKFRGRIEEALKLRALFQL